MEEGRPSFTAAAAAMWRAAHVLLDEEPKILRDDLALGLSGADSEATLQANIDALLAEASTGLSPALASTVFRSLRAAMIMRSRYTEDALSTAIQRGISQYVILGAGLDAFAYRRPDLAGILRVFEVDHPASQHWKRTRLRELHVALPPHLTFIPLDFERHTLTEALCAGGYALTAPAFFSWLGVTQYLTEAATFRTLQEVAALAAGTEISLTYVVPETQLNPEGQRLLAVCSAYSAARGEPWLSLFEPASFASRLQALGFTHVSDFSPEEANARYFAGRTDGLWVPSIEHVMRARVGSVC